MLLVESGEEEIINLVIANQSWSIMLYNNNYTPVSTSTYADFTATTVPGVSPVVLNSWGSTGLSSEIATNSYPTITWTPTSSSDTIYGVFIYNNSTNNLIGATLFGTPQTISPSAPLSYNLTFLEMDISLA